MAYKCDYCQYYHRRCLAPYGKQKSICLSAERRKRRAEGKASFVKVINDDIPL